MPQPRARPTAGGSGPTSPTAGRTAASSPGGTHPSARAAASCAAPAPAAVPGAASPPQPPCSAAPSGRSEPLAAALCLQQQQFKPQQLKVGEQKATRAHVPSFGKLAAPGGDALWCLEEGKGNWDRGDSASHPMCGKLRGICGLFLKFFPKMIQNHFIFPAVLGNLKLLVNLLLLFLPILARSRF